LLLAVAAPSFAQDPADPPPKLEFMVRAVVTPIAPFFPEAARARGVRNAVVMLELQVGPDGIVKDLKVVSSGGPEFDDAALVVGRLTVFAPFKKTTLQKFKVTFDLR
jgi:TonB family protein